MGVRYDELDPAQAPAGELAQESGPEGLRFGRADVHAQRLAAAVRVDAHGDDDRHGDDAPVLADLHIGGVDPEIGPIAFDGALQEGFDAPVDLFAQAGDLALGDAAHAHRLDEIVDGARRDALELPSSVDDGGERLFRHPARFEETGK